MEQMMADALLKDEYDQYVYDLLEQRPDATPMSFEEFKMMVIAEGQMSKGPVLPNDPTEPVNPFQPKPQGPVLPDRQMAAYGGIMGMDGRRQYGIGSFFQKLKDKVVDDIIPNEIKENPLATAAILAGGYDLTRDNSLIKRGLGNISDIILGKKSQSGTSDGGTVYEGDRTGGVLKKIFGASTGDNRTVGSDILGSISKNIVPMVGGIGAGLFTKNQPEQPGLPSDNTALNLAEYKKAANLLNQKQGLAADMNFLPAVSARKYSPEEMAVTYAQAANGGRIGFEEGGLTEYEAYRLKNLGYDTKGGTVLEPFGGIGVLKDILRVNRANGGRMEFNMGGGADMGARVYAKEQNKMLIENIIAQLQSGNLEDQDRIMLEEQLKILSPQPMMAMGGRIGRAEGGIMDLGGMEKDYRAEGGFVPIGKEEKADDVPARLSVNEFVFTADAVRNAGGGDIDQGAQVMENMMKHLEQGGQVSEESQGMQGARDMFATSERLSEVI
jgi:hypothetical protein